MIKCGMIQSTWLQSTCTCRSNITVATIVHCGITTNKDIPLTHVL